ncbi:MAG: hypothetical protein JWM49_2725 [Microbacteriaceae bacterium]|nr:hypothetical protein [Microbacteriaceae bacterium]
MFAHRAPSARRSARTSRKRLAFVVAAVAGIAALTLTSVTAASAATAAQTVFVTDSFTGASIAGYIKPAAPASSNVACLTAGSDTAATPVPGCSTPAVDTGSSGALRLTSATQWLEGGVGATQSVPISKGIDAHFDSYQYGGSGADGIVFYLAVTDPYNPQVPTSIGQAGGSLGYSASGSGTAAKSGLDHGYLGLGLDNWGNYVTSGYEGAGCTPSSLSTTPSVTVRGPGNGTQGYCLLGQDTSIGSNALHGTDRASSDVPVEVIINPSNAIVNSAGTSKLTSASVAAASYAIVYKIGTKAQTMLTGLLPNLKSSTYIPASWYNPSTGLPYKLTYGWVASTGGSTDIHEINNFTAQTLTGPVPVLAATSSVSTGTPSSGSTATYTVKPSVTASGGSESENVQVTTTFPAGITPLTYTGTDYTCTISGQVETCTYTGTTAAGASLPALSLPFTAAGNPGATPLSISSVVASTDATVVTTSSTVTIGKVLTTTALSLAPTSPTYGSSETFTATVSPSAGTGTVAFTDTTTGATLCATAPVTNGIATCTATTAGPAGSHTITATYSGDTTYATSTGTTTAVTQSAPSTITVAASPATVKYGTPTTLSAAGLPAGATGTVSFADAGGNILCTSTAATHSCATSSTLASGSYAVTAAYSGDANYAAATSTIPAQLTVTKASAPALGATVDTPSVPFGSTGTFDTSGLRAGATGTITYTTADGTILCTATAPATSCASSSGLSAGSYTVTATYSGDANYTGGSSAAISFTVTKAAVTITATVNGGPNADAPFSTPATLDTSGVSTGATGSIQYTDQGGNILCTVTLPATSCATAADLAAGTYHVTATYQGDVNFDPATTTITADLTVTKASAPAFQATVDDTLVATIIHGATATLTTTGLAAGATGTIAYTAADGTVLCTATLPDASCTTEQNLPGGTYAVTPHYSGDSNHLAANGPRLRLTVQAQRSAIVAGTTVDNAGSTTTLTATGIPTGATGTITFTLNGTLLCTATLPDRSCTTTALGSGTHSVLAAYSGDASYAASRASVTVTVPVKAAALAFTGSPLPIPVILSLIVALLALGLLLVAAARRRRNQEG